MRALVRTTMLGVALAFAATNAPAQTYPSKPITIVIGYTPGAVSDLAARTLSDGLQSGVGPAGDRGQPPGQRRQYRARLRRARRPPTATR